MRLLKLHFVKVWLGFRQNVAVSGQIGLPRQSVAISAKVRLYPASVWLCESHVLSGIQEGTERTKLWRREYAKHSTKSSLTEVAPRTDTADKLVAGAITNSKLNVS